MPGGTTLSSEHVSMPQLDPWSGFDLSAASGIRRRGVVRQALTAAAGLAGASQLLLGPRAVLAQSAGQGAPMADWDVPGGHFYTQTAPSGSPPDSGYVVSDDQGIPFW